MSKTSYLKPSTKGMRGPLDNGSVSDMIVNPPRYCELGGLTSASKLGPKGNTMKVKPPGSTLRKAVGIK